jgi:PAS domain S-box-containing protein
MFDSFLAVPLHFTIEFVGFLVVAGGAFLVASRPSLIPGGSTSRGSATLGFAALAVAQVAHGGSFEIGASDTDEVLVALKTFGLALILIGVVGGVREGAAPALAAAPFEPFAFAPALAAGAVALMAFVGSIRGGTRDLRRLAFGVLLLGVGEAFTAATAPGGEAPLDELGEVVAHGVRGLGYVWLAAWLWTGVRSSIRTRFVASFVSLLVVVVLALSIALTGVITDNIEDGELTRVERQMRSVLDSITGTDREDIVQDARVAAGIAPVQIALADGSGAGSLADDIFDLALFDADAILLMNENGRLLGSAGHGGYVTTRRKAKLTTEALFDILGSGPVETVVDGTFDATAELVRVHGAVAITAAAEVVDVDVPNRTVGVVALVDFLDFLTVRDISRNVAARASIVIGRRLTASAIPDEVPGREIVPPDVRDEATSLDGIVTRKQQLGGTTYYSAIAELRREDEVRVGYIVLSSPAQAVATAREGVTRTLFLVALGAGAIVLLLAYVSGRRITRPIQELTATAQQVREGDLQAQSDVSGEDEVGQLGETFNEMTAALFRMTNDLRQAAREEHQLRARIETIIESMADGLVAVGPDMRILAFNREAEAITGIPADEARGSLIDDVVVAVDTHGETLGLPIYTLGEGSASGIFIKRRGDEPVPATVVSAVLRTEEDETAGGVAVIRDMTREREVERMKSEFLSNISHELRTPLTPIKGYAEILNRKEMPADKTKQFSKGILESTLRLERIVELLVDFAALEAGRLSPRAASVDLADMVQRLAEEWEGRTPRHQIVTDLGSRLPKVIGDERLLRRSLEEIMDNAIKFSPQGGTITLKVTGAVRGNGNERRKGARAVEITISDEGIGIPAEDVSKIFSDFQQLDGSETRTYGGLGLGLAFVRRIVEAHDGSIRVDSQPERGTQLTVSIPAAKGRAHEPTPVDD